MVEIKFWGTETIIYNLPRSRKDMSGKVVTFGGVGFAWFAFCSEDAGPRQLYLLSPGPGAEGSKSSHVFL